MNFADAAAPAAPTGTLTVVFTTTGTMGVRASGGTARYLAASGHEHTITSVASGSAAAVQDTGSAWSAVGTYEFLLSTASTLGGTGSRGVVINADYVIDQATNATARYTVRVRRETTVLATATLLRAGIAWEHVIVSYVDAGRPSGSVTYDSAIELTMGQGTLGSYKMRTNGLVVHEIKVP